MQNDISIAPRWFADRGRVKVDLDVMAESDSGFVTATIQAFALAAIVAVGGPPGFGVFV